MRHGTGEMRWDSGSYYTGEFQNDMKHGVGVYYWADVGDKYSGVWHENIKQGEGEFEWADGRRYKG